MVSAGRASPRYSSAADLQGEKNGITSPAQRLEKLLHLIGSIPLSPFRKVIRRIIPQYGRGSQVRVKAMPPGCRPPSRCNRSETFGRCREGFVYKREQIAWIGRVARAFRSLPLVLLFCAGPAARSQTPERNLADLSLEDLMNIQVTSVSKKQQRVSQTAAAIFVITAEDIRRSGAINVPDLLRMVPGVHVAQLDANIWVITIRGFSDRFADKVLVLIDGRTVYTPTSSGVYWDQQDVPLEDIERIEVIRGPGGTVWGANAVNGVISITTKSANGTLGGLISTVAGSQETSDALLQYGGNRPE